MSTVIYIDNEHYRLTNESETIRVLEPYLRVREELNRRQNPMAGACDWEAVRRYCEELALGPGIDFMMCGYYAIASLKTRGITGYATGMELLCSSLANQHKGDAKTAKMRKDILDWVNARAVQELKTIKPNNEFLRELYRAEQYCDRLHQIMVQQTDYKVDFESIGFVLFEHIDRIETLYHNVLKKSEPKELTILSFWQKRNIATTIVLFSILLGIFTGWFAWTLYYTTPFSQPQLVTILDSSPQSLSVINKLSSQQKKQWGNRFIPLYEAALEHNINESFSTSKQQAIDNVFLLRYLYPEHTKTNELTNKFNQQQQLGLEQTELFITKFREIRTQMANIALLAKREKWSDLQKQTKSLETFALSLSPIYGRVEYVQNLIEEGDILNAQREFQILKGRLDNLSWAIAEIEQQIMKNNGL
jgi:type VI secretion system protein VasL